MNIDKIIGRYKTIIEYKIGTWVSRDPLFIIYKIFSPIVLICPYICRLDFTGHITLYSSISEIQNTYMYKCQCTRDTIKHINHFDMSCNMSIKPMYPYQIILYTTPRYHPIKVSFQCNSYSKNFITCMQSVRDLGTP